MHIVCLYTYVWPVRLWLWIGENDYHLLPVIRCSMLRLHTHTHRVRVTDLEEKPTTIINNNKILREIVAFEQRGTNVAEFVDNHYSGSLLPCVPCCAVCLCIALVDTHSHTLVFIFLLFSFSSCFFFYLFLHLSTIILTRFSFETLNRIVFSSSFWIRLWFDLIFSMIALAIIKTKL